MADSRRFRAIIADDHQIVRGGLRAALEAPGLIEDAGIEVVGEAENGLVAIELTKRHRPDLALLDVSMPFASGAEILVDLRRWSPDTKLVFLTAITSPGLLASLVEAGADGLFSKASDNTELFDKLPLILRGGRYVEARLAESIREATPMPDLTQRERQTLTMIVAGKSNAEIAGLMGVSPKTAEKHRTSLMSKLQVRSVVELMSRALKDGLIEQTDLSQ